jgi:electron transfer flavoprotein beta subunit
MKILVPLSRTEDPQARIRLNREATDIDRDGVSMVINPFDEIAVEEALRVLADHGTDDSELIVCCIGEDSVSSELRRALAMGAHRAIQVSTDADLSPEVVTPLLAALARRESPDLIIMGKQSIDGDSGQVPQRLAQNLGWPQGTFAFNLTLDGRSATVGREVDGGTMSVGFDLPGIVSTDLRLNEPRLPKLPDIMKAKRKPYETLNPDELGGLAETRIRVTALAAPPARAAGQIVADVDTLITKLTDEAKVLG